MAFLVEKARRAWVRLPRPLHAALAELRAEHPRPVVFGTSHSVRFEPRLSDWRLIDIKPAPNPINPAETVHVASLNRFGAAFAKHLPPLSADRRTLAPLMPLADILADLPPAILSWLSGTPPIAKHDGGILFEALGVLMLDHRGDAYNPSRELLMALDELDFRRRGGVVRQDGPVAPLLSSELTDVLRLVMQRGGVPWKESKIDGRLVRSIGTTDGAGLLGLRTIAGQTHLSVNDQEWAVPHMMRPVVQAILDGETDPFRLLVLTPKAYQEWVADGLPINSVPPHPRLLALIGIIRRKGKYDWQFAKGYAEMQQRIAAHLRAYYSGTSAVADDSAYDGAGVDITLPDDVDDIAVEMTMDLSLDTEFAEHGGIIEAPTPPFTKDGGSYRLTVEDHRQDYLDSVAPDISATDDEFDIL